MIRKGLAQNNTYEGATMTVVGTRNKTLLMLAVTALAFIATWFIVMLNPSLAVTLSSAAGITALVLALVATFNPHRAKTFGLLYALCEGVVVGSVSFVLERMFEGIVARTTLLTLLAVVFTLLLYNQAPTLGSKIRRGVMIATLCVAASSLIGFFFSLFGIPFFLWTGGIGILFSLVVVVIAIANLIVDYDNVVQGAAQGLPQYMEWYFAFGIMVTVIWLYMELLRLLALIASND